MQSSACGRPAQEAHKVAKRAETANAHWRAARLDAWRKKPRPPTPVHGHHPKTPLRIHAI